MFPKLNLQYLISYFGIFPFIFIIFNKYYFFKINFEVYQNFTIYYCLIILVFIGAINWNLQEKINDFQAIYGFTPSLFAVFIIIINLYNLKFDIIILIIILFFYIQLICDYFFLYSRKKNKNPLIFLRLPLTIIITTSLLIIKY